MTKLIPEERISECIVEEITDVPVPRRRTRDSHAQEVWWKEAGIHNEGRVRSVMKMKRTSLKSSRFQVGQNPRHVCLAEGVCLAARVNTGSAVQQQCSSAADKGWRFVPDAILPGHRRAPQWVPARTPTVHWGLNRRKAGWPVWSRQQIHGKHGCGAGCLEQVVNVTGRLVAKEWNKVPQETYNAKSRRVAWVDVQQTRRGDRP